MGHPLKTTDVAFRDLVADVLRRTLHAYIPLLTSETIMRIVRVDTVEQHLARHTQLHRRLRRNRLTEQDCLTMAEHAVELFQSEEKLLGAHYFTENHLRVVLASWRPLLQGRLRMLASGLLDQPQSLGPVFACWLLQRQQLTMREARLLCHENDLGKLSRKAVVLCQQAMQ